MKEHEEKRNLNEERGEKRELLKGLIANLKGVVVIVIIALIINPILNSNDTFRKGTYGETSVKELIDDMPTLYQAEFISEDVYQQIEDAISTFALKAWQDEEITKEDIENYNKAIESIEISKYSSEKLGNGKNYRKGFRYDFKAYLYRIILGASNDLPEEKYDALFLLYKNCIGGSEKEYEQFFKYAEKLYSEYVQQDYVELLANGDTVQILNSIS